MIAITDINYCIHVLIYHIITSINPLSTEETQGFRLGSSKSFANSQSEINFLVLIAWYRWMTLLSDDSLIWINSSSCWLIWLWLEVSIILNACNRFSNVEIYDDIDCRFVLLNLCFSLKRNTPIHITHNR